MANDNNFSGTNKIGGAIRTSTFAMALDVEETDNLAEFERTDLQDGVKEELVSHASALQSGATDNRFKTKFQVVEGITEGSSYSPEGETVPFNPDGSVTGYETKRMSESSPDAISSFENLSRPKTIEVTVKKGKSSSPGESWDNLLADAEQERGKSKLGSAIVQRIAGNSNFNPNDPLINPDSKLRENESNVGSFFIHRSLGVHLPQNWPVPQGEEPGKVNIETLKSIGLLMMMNSTGDFYVPDDPNDILQGIAAKAQSLVPGQARIGMRVPTSRFGGTEILEQISDDFKRPTGGNIDIGNGRMLSYGSFNNPLVPFEGLSPTSARAAATLLSLTVTGLLKAYAAVFKRVFRLPIVALGQSVGQDRSNGGLPIKGEWTSFSQHRTTDYGSGEIVPFILKTEFDFENALNRGFQIMFNTGDNPAQTLINALSTVAGTGVIARSTGYFLTLLREIIRSTNDIIALGLPAFAGNVSELFSRSGVSIENVIDRLVGDKQSPDLGLANDIATSLVSLLEEANSTIFESKLTKIINIIAAIGDISLSAEQVGGNSVIDAIDDQDPAQPGFPNLAQLVSKNRLSDNVSFRSGRTAWAANNTPSKFLIPNTIVNGADLFANGRENGVLGALNSLGANAVLTDNGRLEAEDIQQFENDLDASYVPFYFHDLRTNEIISFHAFIEDISDSFRADIVENEAYGRMGKILTHKNFNRNLSLSFKVVATSKNDFDLMWFKINKLLSMMQPQYTRGRLLESGNEKFIQPFSQIPGASPLIRLRVGDLITTNFSDFDLARQFGVTSADFNPGSPPTDLPDNERYNQEYQRIEGRMRRGEWNVGDRGIVTRGTVVSDETSSYSFPSFADADVLELLENQLKIGITLPDGAVATFYISPFSLSMSPEFIASQATQNVSPSVDGERNNQRQEAMSKFFGNENPIVRSFASVRGQGLPGMISDLNLDTRNSTWEIDYGSRAPKVVGISITFVPVFEINPGLDADGFMQGAVYNIGNVMNGLKKTGSPEPWSSERYQSMIGAAKASLALSKRRRGTPP